MSSTNKPTINLKEVRAFREAAPAARTYQEFSRTSHQRLPKLKEAFAKRGITVDDLEVAIYMAYLQRLAMDKVDYYSRGASVQIMEAIMDEVVETAINLFVAAHTGAFPPPLTADLRYESPQAMEDEMRQAAEKIAVVIDGDDTKLAEVIKMDDHRLHRGYL